MTQLRPNQQRALRFDEVLDRCLDRDSQQERLVDLLADAMHWCDDNIADFHYAFAQACRHYIHELHDEQHNERRIIP